ncbi:MAG: hypothetical protein ACLU4N_21395 [Butyricimonas faecihominis]
MKSKYRPFVPWFPFDNDPMTEKQIVKADGGIRIHPAKANGQLVGTAIKTFTNNGFGPY